MTVLRPSLPPVISSTTRMLSLPGAAACAVRDTNCGTIELRATSDEPFKRLRQKLPTGKHVLVLREWINERISRQLIFRDSQDGMDGLAHAAGQSRAGGIALGHERHELRPHPGRMPPGTYRSSSARRRLRDDSRPPQPEAGPGRMRRRRRLFGHVGGPGG